MRPVQGPPGLVPGNEIRARKWYPQKSEHPVCPLTTEEADITGVGIGQERRSGR